MEEEVDKSGPYVNFLGELIFIIDDGRYYMEYYILGIKEGAQPYIVKSTGLNLNGL